MSILTMYISNIELKDRIMRWDICQGVAEKSFDYFEKTLITDNGFREYDLRWLVGREINPNGFLVLGRAYGTYAQKVLGESKVIVEDNV